jgi:hypothetical protein
LAPDPNLFPPPSCLFAVAQAMRSASLRERLWSILAFFDVFGPAFLFVGVGRPLAAGLVVASDAAVGAT